jgi:GT2 family glycosyltransferase
MPVYNAQRYLAEAIGSVLAQSLPDWELLLIDDGSTDAGPAIARDFAARDGRIVLLASPLDRRGAAVARNTGIAAARGDYVSFLDADDLYEPGKLAAHVAALDADPDAAWLYGATRWFYEGNGKRDYRERLGVRLDRQYAAPTILNRIILEERGDIPCTCGVMIRREVLNTVGGFEECFALYEDQSLWVKLLLSYPVRVVSGCHAAYRQHEASTSSAAVASGAYNQTAAHPARDAFLAWIGEYAKTQGAPPSVLAALETAARGNSGRLRHKLARTIRIMNRFLP